MRRKRPCFQRQIKRQYKDTSVAEIKAFFGLLYMRGALCLNLVSIDTVFYYATSNPVFSAAFERKRFSLLCQFIQFDNASVCKEQWKSANLLLLDYIRLELVNQLLQSQVIVANILVSRGCLNFLRIIY